jgi:hypothetical protein
MGQDMLRQKITQRLSKDPQGVIRTLKTAGVKLSSAEEAGISKGSLDQFSDAQLGERFNSKVLGMLGITGAEGTERSSQGQSQGQGKYGSSQEKSSHGNESNQGKNTQQKSDSNSKKRKPE